jgi:hypothetical protein
MLKLWGLGIYIREEITPIYRDTGPNPN